MRTIRIGGLLFATLAAGALIHAALADGPWGALPGAALRGEPAPAGVVPDWRELATREAIEVQVAREDGARPHSVMACLLLHEDRPFLSVTLAPLKRWHRRALAVGEVRVREGGLVFARRVVPVEDASLHEALKRQAFEKYRSYEFGDGWAGRNLAFLELVPSG